jgi:hypothetical protein
MAICVDVTAANRKHRTVLLTSAADVPSAMQSFATGILLHAASYAIQITDDFIPSFFSSDSRNGSRWPGGT